jgi:hypothetical protein
MKYSRSSFFGNVFLKESLGAEFEKEALLQNC